MTLADLRLAIGRKTAIVDNAGTFVDGIVTQAALDSFINLRYRKVFMMFAEKFPHEWQVRALSTLTASQSEYYIDGDALDALEIFYVGVKYASTATSYTRAKRRQYDQIFKNNTSEEGYSTAQPFYILGSSKIAATDENPSPGPEIYPTIQIVPTPTATVTSGLLIKYVEIPEALSDTTDPVSAIPSSAHDLIVYYTIADVWEAKGDWAKSERAMNRAIQETNDFFNNYQPTNADEPVIIDTGKRYYPNSLRRY